ncbi:hypothetical protein HAX54_052636, partial [Datura stramonium]|nr:hypothetical protein [Datura stramonium]
DESGDLANKESLDDDELEELLQIRRDALDGVDINDPIKTNDNGESSHVSSRS